MDQPVFINYNGLRLQLQQQGDDQQQQQQFQSQGIIMNGGDQSQEVIVQDDQSHVVYSPIKTNEQHQYIAQDDSMQSQYLIQSPAQQQPQQLFYNISPQNQNQIQQQQQTIALNHNIIAQQNQQKLVLQAPKVVVQRNNELLQSGTNISQLVDHQNQTIQYHFTPPMEQGQTQQLIIQQPSQQIKQTIYPQQPNQVVTQPQYFQLQQIQQPNIVQQQGTQKLLMQNNQVRYSFVQNPRQIGQHIGIQNQSGQIMQINQQQPQIQTQNVRQFRPRVMAPVRVRVSSPHQQGQVIGVGVQRPRVPRPRVARPTPQNPLIQNQSPQNSPQPRPPSQGNNNKVYVIQTQPDGSQVLVPHPQYGQQNQQPQQIIRMVQQTKVGHQQTNQQQHFQVQNQIIEQPSQPPPLQVQSQPEQAHAPATSTFTPKKDGDCDDLEESITATAISKSTRSEPPPLQPQSGISMDEYRKRGGNLVPQNPPRVGVVRPMMSQGNPIRPQARNLTLQVIRQRPVVRQQFQQAGLTQELEVPERESAKMLVILDNGEQRLITFTLPKETCTVQELLDQVGIQVGADSNIECIENPGSEIDYIVKVGNFASRDTAAMTKAAENHIRQQQQHRQQLIARNNVLQQVPTLTEAAKSKSPEPKAVPAKYVPGFYALCGGCGYSSPDHAKCLRCSRVFHEAPKTVRMTTVSTAPPKNLTLQAIATSTQTQKLVNTIGKGNIDKKDQIEALQRKHQLVQAQKGAGRGGRGGMTTSTPRGRGARASRAKITVPEIVTLSSDDESSDESKSSGAKAQALKKKEEIVPKKLFEPDIIEDVVADDFVRSDVADFTDVESKILTNVTCRTVRIGSYKFDSKEKVVITSKGIKIVAPIVKNPKEFVTLNIMHSEIVKVVVHFSKQLHIIFVYTKPSCGRFIVKELSMAPGNDKSPFYSPLSRSEPQKKIVFLAESITEETKSIIKSIYSRPMYEEINNRDANEMLVRSTGIPLASTGAPALSATPNTTADQSSLQDPEIRRLLIYPPGRFGIAINTNDYVCLGSDNYLNDVIIDFFLKYLHKDVLTEEQHAKTYIFSQFFYKRLTTMQKEKDPKLSAAQKRHGRVASWTKNVNLFEKDYIIIPINEQSHWFLAIICFANLTEPHTMDTNQPIKLLPVQKRAKKKAASVQIGNTTITPLTKREESINLHDDEGSERDEAEGDESDLGSNLESEDEEEVVDNGQPVKVPCILIFDSLQGAPRSRVVATLRDYLTCEYKAKFPKEPLRQYTKLNIFGNQVKVPQQNNFTDCGVFLLQYVEQFFKDPIKDFRIPIKSLVNWFHQDVVTRKREEIAKLIEELITKTTPNDEVILPPLQFPTKDGKILEQPEEQDTAVEGAFDDDEYVPTEEDLKDQTQNGSKLQVEETKKVYFSSKKRSLDKNDSSSGESGAKVPKFNTKNKP